MKKSKPKVTIQRNVTYDNVFQAVEKAFAYFCPDIQGKTVLIKPNILSPTHPDKHVTTHPAVVKAVLEAVLKRNPKKVMVGDNSGLRGFGAHRDCFEKSGLAEVADNYYVNLGEQVVEVPFPFKAVPSVHISKLILEADIVINLPKFKTHSLTTLTCAIKNTYGYLVGGMKTTVHQKISNHDRFNEAVVEIYKIRPPEFTIVDAVVGMEGMGPSGAKLRPDMQMLIAGDNGVAVDAVVARLMGLQPQVVPMLKHAHRKGLGPIAEDEIDLIGDATPILNFKLPNTFLTRNLIHNRLLYWLAAHIVPSIMVRVPFCIKEKCTQCGLCQKHCPVGAITMDGTPRIDIGKCIRCYCCIEFCQYQALSTKRILKMTIKRQKKQQFD